MQRLPVVEPAGPEQRRYLGDRGCSGLSGDVFTYGSGDLYPWAWALSRTGWAVVQCDKGNRAEGVFGTLPGGHQSEPAGRAICHQCGIVSRYKTSKDPERPRESREMSQQRPNVVYEPHAATRRFVGANMA